MTRRARLAGSTLLVAIAFNHSLAFEESPVEASSSSVRVDGSAFGDKLISEEEPAIPVDQHASIDVEVDQALLSKPVAVNHFPVSKSETEPLPPIMGIKTLVVAAVLAVLVVLSALGKSTRYAKSPILSNMMEVEVMLNERLFGNLTVSFVEVTVLLAFLHAVSGLVSLYRSVKRRAASEGRNAVGTPPPLRGFIFLIAAVLLIATSGGRSASGEEPHRAIATTTRKAAGAASGIIGIVYFLSSLVSRHNYSKRKADRTTSMRVHIPKIDRESLDGGSAPVPGAVEE